ncbi:MAG TPA: PAS domain-containing protein, partial [Archangium sp.]
MDGLDFRVLFEAVPAHCVVFAPDAPRFTCVAASNGYLAVSGTPRESLLGRGVFEVFPDENPENTERSGVRNLRASLETVLRTRAPHRMAVQRYDVEAPGGSWAVRYWAPYNVPVLGPDGDVLYL